VLEYSRKEISKKMKSYHLTTSLIFSRHPSQNAIAELPNVRDT
jgi:hypothetical protein